jgi:hypothetical protein
MSAKESRELALALVFVAGMVGMAVCGCNPSDPGWGYEAPSGRPVQTADGLRYEVPAGAGTRVQVRGTLFAGTADVDVEVWNAEATVLDVDLDAIAVRDSNGRALKERKARRNVRCGGQLHGTRCTLAAGQSCFISAGFNVKPVRDRLLWRTPNPDLRELSVSLQTIERESRNAPLTISLVWDR